MSGAFLGNPVRSDRPDPHDKHKAERCDDGEAYTRGEWGERGLGHAASPRSSTILSMSGVAAFISSTAKAAPSG